MGRNNLVEWLRENWYYVVIALSIISIILHYVAPIGTFAQVTTTNQPSFYIVSAEERPFAITSPTNPKPVPPGSQYDFKLRITNVGKVPGMYKIRAMVMYNGQLQPASQWFSGGTSFANDAAMDFGPYGPLNPGQSEERIIRVRVPSNAKLGGIYQIKFQVMIYPGDIFGPVATEYIKVQTAVFDITVVAITLAKLGMAILGLYMIATGVVI